MLVAARGAWARCSQAGRVAAGQWLGASRPPAVKPAVPTFWRSALLRLVRVISIRRVSCFTCSSL